jgi:hypothetical protein
LQDELRSEGRLFLFFGTKRNTEESKINSTGNLYSKPSIIEVNESLDIDLVLTEIVPPLKVLEHELIKDVPWYSTK